MVYDMQISRYVRARPPVQWYFNLCSWGVSNHWTGIWNGTMEWKMEWNSEHAQLQVTHAAGTAQARMNYLVYIQACYLTAEAL